MPDGNGHEKLQTMDKVKVTPEALMVIYLDEIAGRLSEINDLLVDMGAEGITEPDSLSITDRLLEYTPPRGPWKSFALFNDGDDAVFYSTNENRTFLRETSLASGDSVNMDAGRHTIRKFFFVCDPGESATVRLLGLR